MSRGRWVLAVVVLLLVATAGGASAYGGGTQQWSAGFHEGEPAFTRGVEVSPTGSTIFVAGVTGVGGGQRMATAALVASTGERLWSRRWGGLGDEMATDGRGVALSPDGSTVFVTGGAFCPCADRSQEGAVTIAYDAATGMQRWVARDTDAPYSDSIAVSPDGSTLFVNGPQQTAFAGRTVALDAATGARLWAVDDSAEPMNDHALVVSPDGRTVFVGQTSGEFTGSCGGGNNGLEIAALDTTDGSTSWRALHVLDDEYDCGLATSIALSSDGSTVLVAGAGGPWQPNLIRMPGLAALDAATGAELWSFRDEAVRAWPNAGRGVRIAVDPQGAHAFLLSSHCILQSCAVAAFVTSAFDLRSGARQWRSFYESGGEAYPVTLEVSRDGTTVYESGVVGLPCFGSCDDTGNPDYAAPLVAYDTRNGIERWATSFPRSDVVDLAVSPDGANVFTAGSITGSTGSVRARGTRCTRSCGWSIVRYSTSGGRGRFEDTDTRVKLSSWRGAFEGTALGGAFRSSSAKGAWASYTTPVDQVVTWRTRTGPDQGKARLTVDGRAVGVYDLYSATPGVRLVTVQDLARRQHHVRVTVLGTRNDASAGTVVALDAFLGRPRAYVAQESSRRVRYDGWSGVANASASGGSCRRSANPKARMALAFTGRSIRWITATGPGMGRARVVVDGQGRTVDLYQRAKSWRVPISITGLKPGRHRVVVRPLGTKNRKSRGTVVVSDAFVAR